MTGYSPPLSLRKVKLIVICAELLSLSLSTICKCSEWCMTDILHGVFHFAP